jgi:protein-S-isoprenylcysteine O-methyltransferase Ste14
VLGQFYTRTLRVADRQTVVDQGPYRLIRHPGYAGNLALWIGAGLATGNGLTTIVITVAMFVAYSYRLQAEEQMLLAMLGQPYREYQARTRRLIPFVY